MWIKWPEWDYFRDSLTWVHELTKNDKKVCEIEIFYDFEASLYLSKGPENE